MTDAEMVLKAIRKTRFDIEESGREIGGSEAANLLAALFHKFEASLTLIINEEMPR